jgi:hypothetical protein
MESNQPPLDPQNTEADPATSDQLQIAVLISLPSPHATSQEADIATATANRVESQSRSDDDRVGELVFGVTEVPWRGGQEWNSTKDGKKRE